MTATPYSYRQYTGNGSTTSFAVPFPYLLKAHVHVYLGFNILDGTYTVELAETAGYTWTSGTAIQTVAAPASGQTLSVVRQTPSSQQVVEWQDGSTLIAADLNTSDLQNLYVVQEQQDRNDAGIVQSTAAKTAANAATASANTATTTAAAATAAASVATTTANTALSTANTASTNASAAVTTANTASTNASNAVTTANAANTTAGTASTNASAAVTTANAASASAASATTTANTASTNASAAVATANTASSNATAAVVTASTASTNASNAVTTANTASSSATSAVTTANTANTNASTALSTATTANNKADQAISAVSNSINYQLKTNVAAIPATPANDTYIEVQDSTGLESFTPLAGKPAGFVGDSGLSVRLRYTSAGTTWNWLNYYPNNSETRYLKLAGGTLTGNITLAGAPSSNLHPATKGYVDGYVGSINGDIASLSSAKLDSSTAASTYAPLASPVFTGTPTVPGYLTTASASSTYQTQAGMSSYLTTTSASSTYLPTATAASTYQAQAGMSSYLTTTAAGSTYQPLSGMSSYAALGTAQSFTKAQRGTPVALTDAATVAVDLSLSNHYTLGLGGNRTLGAPTNQTAGQSGVIVLSQDATGSRTLAFASVWKFPGGTAPTLTTTANAVDVLAYYVESSTRITARLVSDVK